MAQEVPDARLLDQMIQRYPGLASELTEYAVVLALDALRTAEPEPVGDPKTMSPAINRAFKHFQDRLQAANKHRRPGPRPETDIRLADPPNPFQGLQRNEFRALAERLHANTVFVCKLRDRQIDPDTIPLNFQQRVADELEIPLAAVQAHFAARPAMQRGQYFKADSKPAAGSQQSFEDAVRNSGLSDDQQRSLLKS